MKFALLMSGAWLLLLGGVWVFYFVAMWYGAICIEKAFKDAMHRWGKP